MVDMSAAFDVVDTALLLKKLDLYGLDRRAVQWFWSYLTYRSQGVYIEGSMSGLLSLEAGVPQGSILGPLIYTIFTNELPQVVHEGDCPHQANADASLFTIQCQECGGLCCYADDSTYTVTHKDPAQLSAKLSHKYNILAEFLTDNKLKVNDDKTHLLVMTTRQKRRHVPTSNITITTPTATITPSTEERLLGVHIHQDLRWREQILDNKDSLIKSLNKRQGALKKLSKVASPQTIKKIADGLFMSKLIYLMPVWGGCENYLIKSLQVVQNKVARTVTKLDKFTSTKNLLKACSWMSVRQLVCYHSVVQLQKTLQHKTPIYLHQKVTTGGNFPYGTRLAASGQLRQCDTTNPKDLTKLGWSYRAVEDFNKLPPDVRLELRLPAFKRKLRNWVMENTSI